MSLMDDKQNAYRRYAENIFSGGNELVDPEHRIDVDEMVNWVLREQTTKTEGTEWKGYHFLPGFDADTAKYAYNVFSPKPGDVLVATYAKTGRFGTCNVYQ